MASPAPKATITGTVGPLGLPPGTLIALASGDGAPVLDAVGAQVTVPVATDGSDVIETEQRPTYLLDPIPPAGFVDPPPFAVAANQALVTAPPVTLAAIAVGPGPIASDPPDAALAASGLQSSTVFVGAGFGLGAVAAGLLALLFARVHATSVRRRRSPVTRGEMHLHFDGRRG